MRTALTAILCCAIACSASAEVKPPVLFYERAGQLAEWIDRNSDYGPLKKHPIYLFIAPKELNYVLFDTTAAGYSRNEQSEAVALYLIASFSFRRTSSSAKTMMSCCTSLCTISRRSRAGNFLACAPARRMLTGCKLSLFARPESASFPIGCGRTWQVDAKTSDESRLFTLKRPSYSRMRGVPS